MDTPFDNQAFLFIWVGFLLLMTGGIGAFFFWGVRSGQFANQDRARYLALDAGIPPDNPLSASSRPRDADRREGGDEP